MVTASGMLDVGRAALVADDELRHVDLEHDRDVPRHRFDGDAEHELLEQTTVAHARGLTEEVERHVGAHRDVAADADEVDVHELAPRGVTLDLPDEGEHGVAVDLEVDQGVGAALARRGCATAREPAR